MNRYWLVGLLSLNINVFPQENQKEPFLLPVCRSFDQWKEVKSNPPGPNGSVAEWSSWQISCWNALHQASLLIFDQYRNGEKIPDDFKECGVDLETDRAELFRRMSTTFLDQSLNQLESNCGSLANKLSRNIREYLQKNGVLSFRLLGKMTQEKSPNGKPGGYHRGRASIFMDFQSIEPNEWLYILSHELIHSLDTQLHTAILEFSNPQTISRIWNWALSIQNPTSLTVTQRAELDAWLMAGLNRGLLAESRAWAYGFELYESGLKTGCWKSIDWVERLLKNRRMNESLDVFAFRTLDPGFIDPSEGIFSFPLIKNELILLRQQLTQSI